MEVLKGKRKRGEKMYDDERGLRERRIGTTHERERESESRYLSK